MKITIRARGRSITARATDANGTFVAEAYGTYIGGDNMFYSRTIGEMVTATLRYEQTEGGKTRWVDAERVKTGGTAKTRSAHDKIWRAWFRAEGRAKLATLAAKIEMERGLFAATTGGSP